MIEFKVKYSLANGNKVTKKNWHRVVAISTEPNTTNYGWPVVDEARKNGGYFNRWKLVYEDHNAGPERRGYIFREVNTNSGINGFHPTFKQAIWTAIGPRIKVYLEEPASGNQYPATSIQP